MSFRSVAFVMMLSMSAAAATGCMLDEAEAPELEDVEQEGTFTQGTFTQGTFTQGTFTQGVADGVWGFDYAGWENSGMALRDPSINGGQLRAYWHKTPACRFAGLGLTRSCEWWGAGYATCAVGTPVTVRAGACSLSTPRESMVRVCNGSKPCTSSVGIASSDAPCSGTSNPSVSFTCPATGKYFIMVAPKATGLSTFNYTVSTSPSATINRLVARNDFAGTTMVGLSGTATRTTYRIDALAPLPLAEDPNGRSVFYTLTQTSGGTPLCGGTDNRAIPFVGRWESSGFVDLSTTSFTFACTRGVIAKCYRLGYRPWDTDAGGRSLRDYHQACTRAARADFCNNGSSFTVDGTLIDLHDRLGHVDPAPADQTQGLAFEAVWPREGTLTNDDVIANVGPICLSKKRWDTLPYNGGGSCTVLDDPRTESDDVSMPTCDQLSPSGWFSSSSSALLVTHSAFNDAGLWRWRKSQGVEYRSTTACSTVDRTTCSGGYVHDTRSNEPRFVGAVYAADIAPAALPEATLPLYSMRHLTSGEYLTTTDAEMPGYGPATLEGYILDTSCEATQTCPAKRLDLMEGPGGDYLTTTPLEPVTGYAYRKTLGYLPR